MQSELWTPGEHHQVPISSQTLTEYMTEHTITQGQGAGEPINLFPWEQEFLQDGFAPDVTDAALTIARGNGKTTFISGIGCSALEGPLVQTRGEAIVIASSFEQARIAFEHALGYLEERHPRLHLDSRWRIQDSANRASISDKQNRTRIKCIGSDPSRAHGLAASLFILDEPAQWPRNTRDRMYAAIRTARGKIPNSRLISLGTQSNDTEHWFQKQLAGAADYVQIHAAPKECDPFDPQNWLIANPSMPYMPELEKIIRAEAEDAKHDPALLAQFCALRLNQGVSDIVRMSLLDANVWESIEGEQEAAGECVWGLDLGDGVAQSAITAYWESGRLESLAAFPDIPDLNKRSLQDGVGDGADSLYHKMLERGELLLTKGHVVAVSFLLNEALKRWGQPSAISADRYRARDLLQALHDSDVNPVPVVFRGQGFKDGSEDVRMFKRACLRGRVRPTVSLLLRAGMREAVVIADPAGNQKLAKGTEGGRRKLARDDAVASAILAVAMIEKRRQDEEQPTDEAIYLGKAKAQA